MEEALAVVVEAVAAVAGEDVREVTQARLCVRFSILTNVSIQSFVSRPSGKNDEIRSFNHDVR